MAPVVCPEKKVHMAGVKESRRHGSHVGVALSNSNTATQSSTVLSYVAKGSMNSAGRRQRRRIARLPSRMQHISKSIVSSSSEFRHRDGMDIDEDNDGDNSESSTQISRIHSSSSSSNNIKTVLQPTTANSNSNNSHSCNVGNGNNSKTSATTAKIWDQMPSADNVDDDDDDGGEEEDQASDSGYEFELEPVKQYHTNTEGLLSIALKTIKLVQRNKLLQKRLAQLQLETSEFIASVLANPENRHFRDKAAVKADALNKVSNVLLRH